MYPLESFVAEPAAMTREQLGARRKASIHILASVTSMLTKSDLNGSLRNWLAAFVALGDRSTCAASEEYEVPSIDRTVDHGRNQG
jgi:hypothetical protein